jgi:hypothetical protein
MDENFYYVFGPFNKTNTGKLVVKSEAYVNRNTYELLFLLPENRYNKLEKRENYIPVNEFIEITGMSEKYASPLVIIFANDEHCFVNYETLIVGKGEEIPPNVTVTKT